MFQGVWGWIERSARAAFLRGIQSAIDDLTTADAGEAAPVPRLTLAQASPEAGASPARKRRAE